MDRNRILECLGKTPEQDEQFFIEHNPAYAAYKNKENTSNINFAVLNESDSVSSVSLYSGMRIIKIKKRYNNAK